ncbi:PucR family transcriptional regulator [Microbacterium sp. Clip185]|uniref:PucR family transcriptional regulator n=1 Tax=Microbacterium sp. Clip185 TaxID=3025663 RepID=UPI0023662D40|nr:PucR family transcriptional regulator ligand-binding domain-containing protein [Microbacterium sp. Clip185]WDG17463.1 PucR family transcriptional regulator ligand-binding domain-containing protein [Microbacterium sp. Clip185]
MPLLLDQILADAVVQKTEPELICGTASEVDVRWVHASEQLDIAPLLRGGELILMEGVNLVTADAAELRAYVDTLVARDIAALAVETTPRLPRIPDALLEQAEASGLPVIHLRRRVPFAQICESINSQLADVSLRRLRIADRISLALSEAIENLASIDQLLALIRDQANSSAQLTSLSGQTLGVALVDAETPSLGIEYTAPVSFGGTVVATLTLRPAADADIHLISGALSRAPEILAIALLRTHPLSPHDRRRSRFISLLASSGPRTSAAEHARELTTLAVRLGFEPADRFIPFVVELGDPSTVTAVQDAIAAISPRSTGQFADGQYVGIVGFAPSWDAQNVRDAVTDALRRLASRGGVRAAVGPTSASVDRAVRAVRSARESVPYASDADPVVDAASIAVTRLWPLLSQIDPVAEFIDEQIGALLDRDAVSHGELFDTLRALAENLGSKTDAAASLGIHRQTFYQRFERITAVIGPLEPGSARVGALLTAVFLEQARRQAAAAADAKREGAGPTDA